MARPAASNVVVQWTGTGTVTLSLGSAVAGSQGFPAALNGFKVSYSIEHENGVERESGLGTYTSSGNTLSRDLVDFSTALGGAPNKQNFTAGNKFVRLTIMPRDIIEDRRTTVPGLTDDISAGYIEGRSRVLNTATGAIYMCRSHAAGAAVWDRINPIASGGGTLPPTSVLTTGYQILVTDGPVRTDTTSAGFQIIAPVAPTDGQSITLEDAAEGGSWSVANPVTLVTSDGSTLAGNSGAGGVAHDGGTTAVWRFNAATGDWGYVGEAGGPTGGSGEVTTTQIADDAVTYAKMQNVTVASRLLGRGSAAGGGTPQEISLGAGLAMSGTQIAATGGGTNSFDQTAPYGAGRTNEDTRSLVERMETTRVVNVKDFGALGDASTDDVAAINLAIAAVNGLFPPLSGLNNDGVSRATLLFPYGTYFCNGGTLTTVLAGTNVIMQGKIIRSANYTGTFWQIGSDAAMNRGVKIEIDIRAYKSGPPNNYADPNFIGLKLFNLADSYIHIRRLSDFTTNLQVISKASVAFELHTVGNTFMLGDLKNAQYGLEMLTDGSNGQPCWMTDNLFIRGIFSGNSPGSTFNRACVRIRRITALDFDGVTQAPVANERITSSTSGATGLVLAVVGSTLTLCDVSGTFADNNNVTGNLGAQFLANGAMRSGGAMHDHYFLHPQFNPNGSGTNRRDGIDIGAEVGSVICHGSYNENLNKFAVIRGLIPQVHYLAAARLAGIVSTAEFDIEEPDATTPSGTTVVPLGNGRETTFLTTPIVVTKAAMVGMTLRLGGTGQSVTVDRTMSSGMITIVNQSATTVAVNAGTATRVGGIATPIPIGSVGRLHLFDRGRQYKLMVDT